MAKAFKCDKCGEFYDGASDMQVGLDKQSEIVFRHTLGIKFSPEIEHSGFYLKDLCNTCAKAWVLWWKS